MVIFYMTRMIDRIVVFTDSILMTFIALYLTLLTNTFLSSSNFFVIVFLL